MTDPAGEAPVPSHGRHRRVLGLAGPIILANLSTPLLGAVDTAVMGHLPEAAFLGAVAVGSVIFSFLYWGFGFLRMGTTGFTAQAFGAGDRDELRASLGRPLVLGLGLGLVLLAVQAPLGTLALRLIDADAAVTELARRYYDVRIWSAPFALVNYAVLGWLLGTQRTGQALLLQVWLNGLNIVLDLVFVLGLGWTVAGVAAASVLAEMAAAALGLALCGRRLRRLGGRWSMVRLRDPERLLALLRVNGDIFLRTLTLIFALAYFTATGARLGETTLAANAILMQLQNVLSFGLDGFAHAAEIRVGEAVGRRSRTALHQAVGVAALWAVAVAAAFAGALALGGPLILAAFTSLEPVRAAALAHLPWMVASPFVSVGAYLLDGVFIGATRTRVLRNAMLVSVAGYLAAVELLVPWAGNHGLWAALLLFLALRGLTLSAGYPALLRAVGPAGQG